MPDASLSERLIQLLEPFRYALHGDIDDDFVAYEKIVPIGVVAWNLSLLPGQQRDLIRARVIEGFDSGKRAAMTRFLDDAIGLKRELFPYDGRLIREARITNRDGEVHLQVASASRGE